ncbi:DUF3100 domain-containing protein [Corynebacterium glyciniphilum]|uniref:DUF3100 domain-containing protein n=1 Tax=Corynebacterium glyciniphilum AJ 3170 TaxID=1404245 RepID=X5DNK0_9CORY|nr:DUF3100 domain-containing protein [Corynebacterium glyciniphilum]AHW62859.1 Hypothetical protein CGLY_02055 [Corynebacterium glyciniphilum AJ 3170]
MSNKPLEVQAATSEPRPPRIIAPTLRSRGLWVLAGLIVVIAAIAQFIGPREISLGFAALSLLPMIWALAMGVAISTQRIRPLPLDLQHVANAIMSVAVLVLVARLSFTLGPNIPFLLDAGPALLLQEIGNIIGPICLALPLAVMLRMGSATVGATFSIDREGAFAMVTERFGTNSQQYRGVLSMYIFGSVFGAVIISLIASLASSLGIFDWRALAMGAGVGSGSMMAAGSASVTAAHPEFADQILALSTTANLIASIAGAYLGIWVALPLADRFYRFLTRRQSAKDEVKAAGAHKILKTSGDLASAVTDAPLVRLPLWMSLSVISIAGVVVSAVLAGSFSWNMILTFLAMSVLTAVGIGIARITKGKAPAIIVVITVGTLLTIPASPVSSWLLQVSESVDFLAVITMMLSVAGLSIGKDIPLLRQIGWKIIPVGIVVIVSTYLASTVIAEGVLQIIG